MQDGCCQRMRHWRRHSVADKTKLILSAARKRKRIRKALDARSFPHSEGSVFLRMKKIASAAESGIHSMRDAVSRKPSIFAVEGVSEIKMLAGAPQVIFGEKAPNIVASIEF